MMFNELLVGTGIYHQVKHCRITSNVLQVANVALLSLTDVSLRGWKHALADLTPIYHGTSVDLAALS
jgi:hypothetical protein